MELFSKIKKFKNFLLNDHFEIIKDRVEKYGHTRYDVFGDKFYESLPKPRHKRGDKLEGGIDIKKHPEYSLEVIKDEVDELKRRLERAGYSVTLDTSYGVYFIDIRKEEDVKGTIFEKDPISNNTYNHDYYEADDDDDDDEDDNRYNHDYYEADDDDDDDEDDNRYNHDYYEADDDDDDEDDNRYSSRKKEIYKNLKRTIKLREEQLKTATGSERTALENELDAAKKMLNKLKNKYQFENLQSFYSFIYKK